MLRGSDNFLKRGVDLNLDGSCSKLLPSLRPLVAIPLVLHERDKRVAPEAHEAGPEQPPTTASQVRLPIAPNIPVTPFGVVIECKELL